MPKHNPDNERIKNQYFTFLQEAKRHSGPTVDAVAKALDRFEVHTRHRDFKASLSTGGCVHAAPCRTEQPADRGEAEHGDRARDAGAPQKILPMACG